MTADDPGSGLLSDANLQPHQPNVDASVARADGRTDERGCWAGEPRSGAIPLFDRDLAGNF